MNIKDDKDTASAIGLTAQSAPFSREATYDRAPLQNLLWVSQHLPHCCRHLPPWTLKASGTPWTLKAQVQGWMANREVERDRNMKGIQGEGDSILEAGKLECEVYLQNS